MYYTMSEQLKTKLLELIYSYQSNKHNFYISPCIGECENYNKFNNNIKKEFNMEIELFLENKNNYSLITRKVKNITCAFEYCCNSFLSDCNNTYSINNLNQLINNTDIFVISIIINKTNYEMPFCVVLPKCSDIILTDYTIKTTFCKYVDSLHLSHIVENPIFTYGNDKKKYNCDYDLLYNAFKSDNKNNRKIMLNKCNIDFNTLIHTDELGNMHEINIDVGMYNCDCDYDYNYNESNYFHDFSKKEHLYQ